MYAVDIYKKRGYDIKQFIVQNLIITENNKFKTSPYIDLIKQNKNIKLKEDFRKESEERMFIELNDLNNKL
jgi:hypothetical protein